MTLFVLRVGCVELESRYQESVWVQLQLNADIVAAAEPMSSRLLFALDKRTQNVNLVVHAVKTNLCQLHVENKMIMYVTNVILVQVEVIITKLVAKTRMQNVVFVKHAVKTSGSIKLKICKELAMSANLIKTLYAQSAIVVIKDNR